MHRHMLSNPGSTSNGEGENANTLRRRQQHRKTYSDYGNNNTNHTTATKEDNIVIGIINVVARRANATSASDKSRDESERSVYLLTELTACEIMMLHK
ncbi:unnamed protein product [Calicophoron daubneyi]|uniref:Uncharacterized protein n=1 Tax=Calicophoron daubneyi TaxID=300641 RepID=A0AAV2T5A7_CALDB